MPALEGMRALAAVGVMTTHVAFQTGAVDGSILGAVWGRFDMAVALFFALSGFLLWRPHADAARDLARKPPGVVRYLRHRVVRIWPAYVVVVVVVLMLLPDARPASATVWLANLTLTQVFVPLSLTAGLTQMWSLSVEVSFYLALPLFAWLLVRLRGERARWRIPLLLAAAVLSLGWAWVADALPLAAGVEAKNWLPGHLPWFISGLILAELVVSRSGTVAARMGSRPWPMAGVAAVAFALSCTELAGPTGLAPLAPWQFAVKMVLGAVLGFALLGPLVLGPPRPHPFLDSAPMQALGRWSYAIFIWHLAVLAAVFPLAGVIPFSGSMALVWCLTLLLTIGVSAASYSWIEDPARRWLRRSERRSAAARSAATTSQVHPDQPPRHSDRAPRDENDRQQSR
ncbi:peptidoglycan/LPS O-acetylase OafA/YrhL [Williamsia limnetica]|uniref:Peptidoglycan/LPS O-acetylase OafA/YrhL n=1 Tax=Williamsia limnetica TaxID=882452 RepID=A0A318RPQ3_WILLI|nr:peptidoglycan/LPS O-acetylase OafA/YrhL [Williamsia limnetica]